MPRLKLEVPEHFLFHTDITVQIGDVNYGNHVGNDIILLYTQEARLRFLAEYNWSELQCAGSSLIMSSAEIVYKGQAFYADVLTVDVTVSEIRGTGFDLMYRIHRPSDSSTIAIARTGLAFFDYEAGRPCKTPALFKQTFQPGE